MVSEYMILVPLVEGYRFVEDECQPHDEGAGGLSYAGEAAPPSWLGRRREWERDGEGREWVLLSRGP